MQAVDPVALARQARETFITRRSKEEQKFKTWYAQFLNTPESFKAKIPFDLGELSIEKLIPEWYVEKPNKEICDQQFAQAMEKINIINELVYQYNEEGIRALQEYNQKYGSR